MNDRPVSLSVKGFLDDSIRYRVPMYQRNYAWSEGEITQLIQDIIDCLPDQKPYYIGTLVVCKKLENQKYIYETVDGQQRLTTISLLASFLKNENKGDFSWYKSLCIEFECRERSQKTFETIFNNRFQDDPTELLRYSEINTAILNGYQIIKRILPIKLNEKLISYEEFSTYLLDKIMIMRVLVPDDTDLNHYFEIMNNRGEQLEKHEVLKSRMLEVLNKIGDDNLKKQSQNCFHKIWEACANMEKYVQTGFTPEQRHEIFGQNKWSEFMPSDFDALLKVLGPVNTNDDSVSLDLNDIIGMAGKFTTPETAKDDTPERFNSVINFPNFLLHVLRIITKVDISLDDKQLISTFEKHILKNDNSVHLVKNFAFALLRCKYLFDKYILKREYTKGKDGWCLKCLKLGDADSGQKGQSYYVNTFEVDNNDINRRILMMLAAFHVSAPTLVYKHWLNAALNWLYDQPVINQIAPIQYLAHLESIAKAFIFDRFLASQAQSIEYYKIIYTNNARCQTTCTTISHNTIEDKLSYGNIENNLVFNFLDYLLWNKHKTADSTINAYEFTFRSSVEHFYPQHPLPGYDQMPNQELNSFGNLCLISHSKNSRLSNFMPQQKKEYYKNNTIDSIKQYLMMDDQKWSHWDVSSVREHFNEMKTVLLESLK